MLRTTIRITNSFKPRQAKNNLPKQQKNSQASQTNRRDKDGKKYMCR